MSIRDWMGNRRAVVAGMAGAVTAGVAGEKVSAAKTRPDRTRPETRPNIVLINMDDFRRTDWPVMTRTLAALNGARVFPNFILDAPLCGPSRATLLTGKYVHNHGVLWNVGAQPEIAAYLAYMSNRLDRISLVRALQRVGYLTGLFGKFMNLYDGTQRRPEGWNRWVVVTERGHTGVPLNIDGVTTPYPKNAYATDVLRDFATGFIDACPVDEPLFLYLAPTSPHGPIEVARQYRTRFEGAQVERDAAFNEADVSDKPTHVANTPPLEPAMIAHLDDCQRGRLAMLLSVDEAIETIVAKLRAAGRLDNTYIFITSDNGLLLGQHRLYGKAVPYDMCARVPMLAWGHGFIKGEDRRLVSNVDLAPTIAQIAGATLRKADGMSLLSKARRDYVLLELMTEPLLDGNGFGLRSERLMYFEYANGERELYDLKYDPLELDNLLPPGQPPKPLNMG
ncbi:MAG: sulfatase family protein, partial [Thermomicrobiales bacterium]